MYSKLSIDELIERCQETDGEEGNALKREAARRFREGIGVDVDLVEADYWESQIEQSAAAEIELEISVQETDEFAPIEEPVIADYENMDARALYRAYRTGDPWAVYYFALHMKENGEGKNALDELESLAITLEHALEEGNMSKGTMQMLPLVKLQMGRLYEELNENPDSMQKALACYEEAVLELGCAEAVPDLLRFRAAEDIAAHEKQILSLLSKKEKGSVEDRVFVAELYREMGRKVFAVAVYQELLEQKDLSLDAEIPITKRLTDLNAISDVELQYRSENGDAVATFVLAELRCQNHDYAGTQVLLMQCRNQDERLCERCDQELLNVERILEEISAKEELIRQEELRQEQERLAEQEHWNRQLNAEVVKEKSKGGRAVKKVLIGAAVVVVLLLIIGLVGSGGGVSSQQLETVDAFADIQISYVGAEPDGQVEILNNSMNPFLQTVTYIVTPSSGLRNGDKFTVRVEYDKSLAKESGYRLDSSFRQYTVGGLNSYVTDIGQIDETCRAVMEQQAKDIIEATMALHTGESLYEDLGGWMTWKGSLTYGDPVQTTAYFLTRKQEFDILIVDEARRHNIYTITYAIPTVISEKSEVKFDGTVYFSVEFSDLMVMPDGRATVTLSSAWEASPLASLEAVYKNRVSYNKEWYVVQEYEPVGS